MAIKLIFPEGTTLRNNQMITFKKPEGSISNVIINNEIYEGTSNIDNSSYKIKQGSIVIGIIDTENKIVYYQSSRPLAATKSRDGLMTPTQVTDLNTAKTHISSTSNPHNVTASQVGALPLNGGTMTGAINMGSQQITALAAPSADTDAVNKSYVDSTIATAMANVTTDIFSAGNTAPENTKLLWIDTTASTGGLKYYNGSEWVHCPVAYT